MNVGDRVVHIHHGTCSVTRTETRAVDGRDVDYLVVEPDDGNLALMVPADQPDRCGLRPVIGRDLAEQLLASLSSDAVDGIVDADSWRAASARARALSDSDDPFETARAIRDLTRRAIRNDGITATEESELRRARDLLAGELAASLGVEIAEAERLIDDHVAGPTPTA